MPVQFQGRRLLAGLFLLACACTTPDPGPPAQPNVLLVSIDTLRSDHLGAYGYDRDTSPVLDRLAAEGALFESVVASSSWTLPSHTTLLTGLPPELHGVDTSEERLLTEATTLAEVLHERGYATAGFASGPYLRAMYGHDQGFDTYDESTVWPEDDIHRKPTSPQLETLAVNWLDAWHVKEDEKPFFVFLHMWDPHYDFSPPPPYDIMFDPEYEGTVTGDDFAGTDQVHKDMAARDLEHVLALYDGEIRYTDEHLGRILAALERLGVYDDTIVVVTSDHGEEFFEHGKKGHSKGLYDEVVKIPWVVRYPRRIPAGQRIGNQVRSMDVAPTILGLAGIEPPQGFGSGSANPYREHDLSGWITGARKVASFPDLTAFSHETMWAHRVSVQTPKQKLIVIRTPKGRTVEFYDLANDPGEKQDLTAGGPVQGKGRALLGSLRAWDQHWKGRAPLSAPIELDPKHVEQLRALGYVE
ncbi:MAG: sulfatase [Candidatus Binatia bacterium]|nr:sulfatase [Candidatus Binatia bacterium]